MKTLLTKWQKVLTPTFISHNLQKTNLQGVNTVECYSHAHSQQCYGVSSEMDVDLQSWSPSSPSPPQDSSTEGPIYPPTPTHTNEMQGVPLRNIKHKERSPTIRLQSFTVMGTEESKQATTTTTHYAQHHCQQGHSSVAMECVHKLYKEVEVTSSKVS